MRRLFGFVFLTALLAPARASGQTTIYSTFGVGDSYDPSPGYGLSNGVDPGTYFGPAFSFTYGGPTGDVLSEIRFVAGDFFALSAINLQFLTGAGIETATLLESWSVPADPSHYYSAFDTYQIYTLTSSVSPVLTNGEAYWLRWFGGGPIGAFDQWYLQLNDQGVMGGAYGVGFTGAGGGSWQYNPNNPAPAFDVTAIGGQSPGDVVPEPGTMILLATGLAGLGTLRRGRRRMAGNSSSADPLRPAPHGAGPGFPCQTQLLD